MNIQEQGRLAYQSLTAWQKQSAQELLNRFDTEFDMASELSSRQIAEEIGLGSHEVQKAVSITNYLWYCRSR